MVNASVRVATVGSLGTNIQAEVVGSNPAPYTESAIMFFPVGALNQTDEAHGLVR